MKKVLSLFLIVFLISSCVFVNAESSFGSLLGITIPKSSSAESSIDLSEAFNAGSVAVHYVPLTVEDPESRTIVFPEAVKSTLDLSDEAYAQFYAVMENPVDVVQISTSPNGKTRLFIYYDSIFALTDEQITFIYPDTTRGVADQYGNLERYNQFFSRIAANPDAVAWSHDGRYAVITNGTLALQQMAGYLDPIIIDTVTGQMFLSATYSTKFNQDNYAMVLGATFSPDDRYLYYLVHTTMIDDCRTALMRYDMETAETETVFASSEFLTYGPVEADGSFLALDVKPRIGEIHVFNKITEQNGEWVADTRSLPGREAALTPVRLIGSSSSDHIIIASRLYSSSVVALIVADAGDDYADLNTIWIPDDSLTGMHAASTDELASLPELEPASAQTLVISNSITLSPDGRYAFLFIKNDASYLPYFMDLETMQLVPVTGVPDDLFSGSALVAINNGSASFEWNSEGVLITSPVISFLFAIDNAK